MTLVAEHSLRGLDVPIRSEIQAAHEHIHGLTRDINRQPYWGSVATALAEERRSLVGRYGWPPKTASVR